MDASGESGTSPPEKKYTVRQAAFIGVGAMVGAGIFALLGAAGAVAGAAVWLSLCPACALDKGRPAIPAST
jgi:amino acid transporter